MSVKLELKFPNSVKNVSMIRFEPGTLLSSANALPSELPRRTGLIQFTHMLVSLVLRTLRIVLDENSLRIGNNRAMNKEEESDSVA